MYDSQTLKANKKVGNLHLFKANISMVQPEGSVLQTLMIILLIFYLFILE
jgi:hypothetical protein